MCFDLDSAPPIPVIAGAAVSHEDLDPRGRRREQLRGLRRACPTSRRASGSSSCPTCAGSTASTRSSRCASPSAASPRSRSTTSAARPGSSKRDDDFAYMEHVAQTTPGGDPGRRRRRRSRYLRDAGRGVGLHRRVLLRRPQLVALGRRRARPRGRGRLLRDAGRAERRARARPQRARRDARADPRAAGRRRPEHHRRAQRGLRRRPHAPRASSTRSSPTRARRTASSTASTSEYADASEDAWTRILAFVERYS